MSWASRSIRLGKHFCKLRISIGLVRNPVLFHYYLLNLCLLSNPIDVLSLRQSINELFVAHYGFGTVCHAKSQSSIVAAAVSFVSFEIGKSLSSLFPIISMLPFNHYEAFLDGHFSQLERDLCKSSASPSPPDSGGRAEATFMKSPQIGL